MSCHHRGRPANGPGATAKKVHRKPARSYHDFTEYNGLMWRRFQVEKGSPEAEDYVVPSNSCRKQLEKKLFANTTCSKEDLVPMPSAVHPSRP